MSIDTLGKLSAQGERRSIAAIQQFLRAKDRNKEVQVTAARWLVRLDPNGEDSAALVKSLYDSNDDVGLRFQMIYGIGLAHRTMTL